MLISESGQKPIGWWVPVVARMIKVDPNGCSDVFSEVCWSAAGVFPFILLVWAQLA